MKKNKEQNSSEKEIQEIKVGEVHTMPSRFHGGAEKSGDKKKKKKNLPVIIIGIIAVWLFPVLNPNESSSAPPLANTPAY